MCVDITNWPCFCGKFMLTWFCWFDDWFSAEDWFTEFAEFTVLSVWLSGFKNVWLIFATWDSLIVNGCFSGCGIVKRPAPKLIKLIKITPITKIISFWLSFKKSFILMIQFSGYLVNGLTSWRVFVTR